MRPCCILGLVTAEHTNDGGSSRLIKRFIVFSLRYMHDLLWQHYYSNAQQVDRKNVHETVFVETFE
jgi:hypothetical protein